MEAHGMVLLEAQEMDRILNRMTHQILERHGDSANLALVGILTRGAHLSQRIREKMQRFGNLKPKLGSLDINLYRDDWTSISRQPVLQATDIPFSVEGRRIILVDDVLFTGRTVRAAMDALVDFGRPDRIELAVLVDRGHRELPIEANYVGKRVPTGRGEMVNVFLAETDSADQVVLGQA